jgi:hypothetical protein
VVLLDRTAKQLKSVRLTTLDLYRICLLKTCPDWEKHDRTDIKFQTAIEDMHDEILSELAKRDCDRATVNRYLHGCYQKLILGADRFNLNYMTRKRKGQVAALVQSGVSFADAMRRTRRTKEKGNDVYPYLTIRPPEPKEDIKEYLTYVNDTVKEFLSEHNIPVFNGFVVKPKKATKVP